MKKLLLSIALLASCANVMGNDKTQSILSMFGALPTNMPTLNLMGPPPKSQPEHAEDEEYFKIMNKKAPLTEQEKQRKIYLEKRIDDRPRHL